MVFKKNAMGECLKEHIGNIMGTPWERGGNRHHPHPSPRPTHKLWVFE